jgi:hypothetical protein
MEAGLFDPRNVFAISAKKSMTIVFVMLKAKKGIMTAGTNLLFAVEEVVMLEKYSCKFYI